MFSKLFIACAVELWDRDFSVDLLIAFFSFPVASIKEVTGRSWKKVWGESVPGMKCSRVSFLVISTEDLILGYMFGSSIVWMI